MEILVLGPIQARAEGRPVGLAGHKQCVLLALLVGARGRPVTRDALIEALWPERLPADPGHALDLQVSRLRRAIGSDVVVRSEGGYAIAPSATVDADRFDALVGNAAALPPAAARDALRRGLALWR